MVSNPASLSACTTTTWSLGAEQRFLAAGWTEACAAVALVRHRGVLGIVWGQEGLPQSSSQAAAVGYALTIKDDFSIALSLGGWRRKIKGLAAVMSPTVSMGLTVPLSGTLRAGCSFMQVDFASDAWVAARRQFVVRASIAYEPTDKVGLSFSLQKEPLRLPNLFMAVHYRPHKKFGVATGFSTTPLLHWLSFSFALGMRSKVQLHSGWHPLLGWSNGLRFTALSSVTK